MGKVIVRGELILTDKKTGKILLKKHNLITLKGYEYLAENLNGQTNLLNRISIGSGTTEVNINDTVIENVIYTKNFDNKSFSGNTFSCEIDIDYNDANGQWGNVGVLIDDDRLFNHINLDYTKTITQTLNLKFRFSFLKYGC